MAENRGEEFTEMEPDLEDTHGQKMDEEEEGVTENPDGEESVTENPNGEENVTENPDGEERRPVQQREVIDVEEEEYPPPQFPLTRIKKIMGICMATEEEIDDNVPTGKEKADSGKRNNLILTKEAIYLTTLATEYFVEAIAARAGEITASSKKKTVTFEHLRQALSDSEAFGFLEGCFQPSVIIGD